MPFLSNLLIGLFAGLVQFFAKTVTRKAAFTLGVIVVLAAAFAALILIVNTAISGMVTVLPAAITIPCSWVCPPNISQCLGAYLTARLALFAYQWQMNIMLASQPV